jgi:hypothetical protein
MSIVKSTLTLNSTGAIPSILNFSRSSSATRINSIGLVETLAANAIRQDYHSDPANTGRLRGWLLEESSTNTCLQSADFGTTWITSTSTLTNATTVNTNTVKSPDGTTNADGVVASETGDNKIVAVRQQGFTFTSGTSYTVSVWAKKNVHNFLEISNEDNDGAGRTYSQVFNLATGATGASGGTVDAASIEEYPNNWYRCQVSFTAGASTTTDVYFKSRPDDAVSNDYSVVGSSGMYLWGAQVEELAYATSYIPTTTVSVTRTADVAYIEDTEGMWNWNVGTSIWVDATPLNTTETVTPIYHYQDASNANYISLLSDASFKVTTGGNSQLASDPLDTGFTNTRHEDFRNVFSLEANRLHMAQNGSLSSALPDTSITVPANNSASKFTIKFFHGTGLTSGSGWLSNFRIYSNVLTDLELQNLSFRKNDDAQGLALNAVQVLDGSITNLKLADDAVTSAKIADGTIIGGNIANGAIQSLQIGDDQVTQAKIAAGAVGATEIAANSIGTAHLGVDVIIAEDIAANAITVSELQDGAVIANKIAINAVDGTKIALGSDAQGDIMYYSGSDYVRLPKGTTGQVLTQTATIPEWAADSTNVGGTAVGGDLTGTVSNAQIAANAVTSNEIAANAVDTSEIATNAVGINELDVTDGVNGQYLTTNGSGVLSFTSDSTNVGATAVGGDLSGSVANAQIVANAVDTTELADDAVTAAKLDSDAVVTASIVDGNVSTIKIADNAITDTKLADHASLDASRAVGEDHIKSSAVTETKIADDAVTAAKLASNSVVSASIVDGTIVEGDLANNAVTNNKIAGTAVSNSKLASNAVTTAKIADNQVTIAKLAVTDGTSGQVLTTDGNGTLSFSNDSTNVGGTAVGGDVTGTVSNITIPAGSITSAMIGVDVIVAEDIANNAITVAELSDNSVSTAKIQANAVDGTKIAMGSDAAGDVLYYDGTDYVRLAKGTSGHVLTQGASAPQWAADSTNVSAAGVGGDLTGTVGNAQIAANVVGIAELNVTDGSAGQILSTNGSGVLSFITDPTNVGASSVGGSLSGTVANASIVANAVNGTHIALGSDAAGDVMYYDGTNYVRLGKGTDGEVLTLASGVPSWAADSTNVGGTSVGGDVSGTVSSMSLVANSVDSAEIAANAVGASEIAANAVSISELNVTDGSAGQYLTTDGSGNLSFSTDSTNVSGTSVGGDVSGTVGAITINANAIDGTHIALGSDAAGDIMYYNGSNYVRLAKGTAGQVLTVNSGATAPEWAADSTNVSATAVGGMLTGTVGNASIAAGVVTPTMLSASGTASSSTFLRGDGQWATVPMVETDPTAVTMAIALG